MKFNFRRLRDRLLSVLAGVFCLITLTPLLAVLFYIGKQGIERIDLDLFRELPPAAGMTGGGIANAILGTLLVIAIATLIATPIGILTGIYLSEFIQHRSLRQGMQLIVNVLSGLPSILAGVFVYGVLVVNGILGFSAIAGGIALSVLMLPLIIRTTENAFSSVSQEIRLAGASVGATRFQVLRGVILPLAFPGVLTGILLSIARSAGETAPLLFTALNSSFWPQGLLEPTPTLSVLIYNFATSPFPAQQSLAAAAALILISLVLVASVLARLTFNRTFER
ncbi:MAG: phosphate ABC transporter permease PstA [Cyanobacteria bacterium]|jgi:phosphate transport system permease protein|nr:phosphate ABC transporter permease PstA [Cyanobacteria bacterium GSL.Bin21]